MDIFFMGVYDSIRYSMSLEFILLCGAFVLLMICSGFCSSSETAFFSLNPLQVRRITKANPSAGGRIHDILARPRNCFPRS
jgi:Mg2+/Co2+ transporter CorB